MLGIVTLMLCLIGNSNAYISVTPTRDFETAIHIAKEKGNSRRNQRQCNLYSGTWVHDSSYPLYYSEQCPYITNEYNCKAKGRPDSDYEKWRWQPNGCSIPRFDARRFLERMRGKRLMFVGDSISLNQFQSMACLLHTLTPNALIPVIPHKRTPTTFRSVEYNVSVQFFWAPYLVQQETNKEGKIILRVDGIEKNGIRWKGVDLLVFESSKWWPDHLGPQRWDIIMEGNQEYTNMDPMVAYRKALSTWSKWISANMDPQKSLVFFRSPSLSHYNKFNRCDKETEPESEKNRVTYNPPLPPHVGIAKQVLEATTFPVVFLDITRSTASRQDGVTSVYGSYNNVRGDCTHWCLPGVPDSWNELLSSYLL